MKEWHECLAPVGNPEWDARIAEIVSAAKDAISSGEPEFEVRVASCMAYALVKRAYEKATKA